MIWKRPNDLEALNANLKNTLCQITGMRVTKVTDTALYGEMPVDKRTHQPMGLLHVVHPLRSPSWEALPRTRP